MKLEDPHRLPSGTMPAWFYSVQAPRTFSALWVFERIASLSVPIAIVCIIAAASRFGWITY